LISDNLEHDFENDGSYGFNSEGEDALSLFNNHRNEDLFLADCDPRWLSVFVSSEFESGRPQITRHRDMYRDSMRSLVSGIPGLKARKVELDQLIASQEIKLKVRLGDPKLIVENLQLKSQKDPEVIAMIIELRMLKAHRSRCDSMLAILKDTAIDIPSSAYGAIRFVRNRVRARISKKSSAKGDYAHRLRAGFPQFELAAWRRGHDDLYGKIRKMRELQKIQKEKDRA